MPTTTTVKTEPTKPKLSPTVHTSLTVAVSAILKAQGEADKLVADAQNKAESVQSGALWKAVCAANTLAQAEVKRADARGFLRDAFTEANGGIYDKARWDSPISKILKIAYESTPADLARYKAEKVGFNAAYAALSKPQSNPEGKSWTNPDVGRDADTEADAKPVEPAPVQLSEPARTKEPAAKHVRLVDAIEQNETVFTDLVDAMAQRGLISYPLVSAMIDRAFSDAQKAEFVRVLLRDETTFRAAYELTHQHPVT